jgi:adenylate kinase
VLNVIHLVADQAKMVERLQRRALRENRVDDASDTVINRRFDVYQKETKPVLDFYPPDKIVRIDAVQSQIRVLGEIIRVLVPLKETHDVYRERRDTLPPSGSAAMLPPVEADLLAMRNGSEA